MKYLLAVSGGVDSVVLLDMYAKKYSGEITIAHFDHGIRPESADDARFVEMLSRLYRVPFVTKREELGPNASEELARTKRYAFLKAEAGSMGASIVTAHHQDDLLETMAINMYRGTGWRGVAAMGDPEILRPLLDRTKDDIYNYALAHKLEWVEDSSNNERKYLRNRLRGKVKGLPLKTKKNLLAVWRAQNGIKKQIDAEIATFLRNDATYVRYFFIVIDTSVGVEILKAAIKAVCGKSVTYPQLIRALLMIKVAKPGATMQIADGISLRFTSSHFVVVKPQKMLS